jgi:ankyrin repeat protein
MITVVLAVLLAASVYAQTMDLFRVVTPQEAQVAISKGADVKSRFGGMTPLMYAAAYNKDPEVITVLLKAGADIEARDSAHGGTALMWAATFNSNPEVITTLLKAGANVNAQDGYDYTPLMIAASHTKNPEVIMTLLKAGEDVRVKNNLGRTALDYAKGNESLQGTDALKQLEESFEVSEKGRHRRVEGVNSS